MVGGEENSFDNLITDGLSPTYFGAGETKRLYKDLGAELSGANRIATRLIGSQARFEYDHSSGALSAIVSTPLDQIQGTLGENLSPEEAEIRARSYQNNWQNRDHSDAAVSDLTSGKAFEEWLEPDSADN